MPFSAKGFTTHDYTASDGKTIYYFSEDGVHCMNMDGSGDQLTSIVNFEYFIAFNTHGLFYVSSDEGTGGYSVMVYDASTLAATTIKTPVYDFSSNNIVTSGSKIYMIDDTDHTHIICYDMSNETLTDIEGIPSEFKQAEVSLGVVNGQVHVAYNNYGDFKQYIIIGIKAKSWTPPEETPSSDDSSDDSPEDHNSYYRTGDGGMFRFTPETNTMAFWTGSRYQNLELPNIPEHIVSGKKLYVFSYERKDNWPDDDYMDGDTQPTIVDGSFYALYSISSDGSIQTLFEGVDMASHYHLNASWMSDGARYDMIRGWYFVFWYTEGGDGGYISGLLLKHKVE